MKMYEAREDLRKIKVGDKVWMGNQFYVVVGKEKCSSGPCSTRGKHYKIGVESEEYYCNSKFILEDDRQCIHAAQCCVAGDDFTITKNYIMKKVKATIIKQI